MQIATTGLGAVSPGFSDPVHDAQSVFSAVMRAMSRPGRIEQINERLEAPSPANNAVAAVILTLCDHDSPLWLDETVAGAEELKSWVRFHCSAPITGDRATADFALVTNPQSMPDLDTFALGTDEFPDRSTTLIVQVSSILENGGWVLSGPGIESKHKIRSDDLSADFIAQWRSNRELFPRGVDVILCAEDRIACLPRTVKIEEG